MPEKTKCVWFDGKIVPHDKATVHVLSQGIHYGSGVFEGIRCYSTEKGQAVFRLDDHLKRLFASAKILGAQIPFIQSQLKQAVFETIRENSLKACYVRPIAFGGNGGFDLTIKNVPFHVSVAVWPWNNYLGKEAETGIKTITSSFMRLHPNAAMTKAKITGNYANSILAKQEAKDHGCEEAIMLDQRGLVAEGTGENIFMVKNNVLYTPTKEAILEGITRDSVMTLAKDKGLEVKEETITRDQLYAADEVFFTGTAAEVAPVREIDGRTIGEGTKGKVTAMLQSSYSDVVQGKNKDYLKWLSFVV